MKILLGLIIVAVILAMVVALYCALIIAVRSKRDHSNVDNNEENYNRFSKKQICPKCKTGKESYNLDIHSDTCPYIGYYKNGKCRFYKHID